MWVVRPAAALSPARAGAQGRVAELSWDLEAPFYIGLIRALARREPIPPPRVR